MDSDTTARAQARPQRVRQSALSYKFQRLREDVREAIASGELQGKLPGERLLAKRFRVNAKTLSKALTDLASEGVLQRSIGRGTYVAGQMPSDDIPSRWLILAEAVGSAGELVTELLKLNPESRCATADEMLRPSDLAHYSAVINCSEQTSEAVYRDLLLRGIPIIETLRPSRTYSTHGVLLDRSLAAFNLGRDLLLAGHTRLATVDARNSTTLFDATHWAIARYGASATVHAASLEHIHEVIAQGVTAILCDGAPAAARVRLAVEDSRPLLSFHDHISVVAVGMMTPTLPCSGYYLDPKRQASVVAETIRTLQPHRLSVLWLNGVFIDHGTLVAPSTMAAGNPAPAYQLAT